MTQDGPGSPSCRVCRQFSIVGGKNDLVARAASQGHDLEDINEGQKYGTGTFGELLVLTDTNLLFRLTLLIPGPGISSVDEPKSISAGSPLGGSPGPDPWARGSLGRRPH